MKLNAKTILGLIFLLLLSFSTTYYFLTRKNDPKFIEKIPEENFTSTEEIIEEETTPNHLEIEVSSFEEFIDNLGDDRTLLITKNIDITNGMVNIFNRFHWVPVENSDDAYLEYQDEYFKFDGTGIASYHGFDFQERDTLQPRELFLKNDTHLIIKNTKNLVIKGIVPDITFTIANQYSPVLSFLKNENLTIENCDVVHNNPEFQECGPNAPVLKFSMDKNVMVNNCSLNGSGTEGVFAYEVDYITINETTIYNCNNIGIDLHNVGSCYLNISKIENNNLENHIINLYDSTIYIDGSEISGNKTYFGKLINFNDKSSYNFSNCYIKDNENFKIDQEVIDSFDTSNTVKFSDFDVQ